jgi:hypothetical protein
MVADECSLRSTEQTFPAGPPVPGRHRGLSPACPHFNTPTVTSSTAIRFSTDEHPARIDFHCRAGVRGQPGMDHTRRQGEMVNAPSTVFQESLLPVPEKINVKLRPPLRNHFGAKLHWNKLVSICPLPNRSL